MYMNVKVINFISAI